MRLDCVVPAIILLSAMVASSSSGASESGTSTERHSIGIGIQAAPFPIVGLSLSYCPSPRFALQAIGKTGYDVDILAARGLYTISQHEHHHWYLSGLLGYFRDPDVSRTPFAEEEVDSAPGFGLGVGVERALGTEGRFSLNAEVDFIHIHFEDVWWEYDYERFDLVMLGMGFTYYVK